MTGWWERHRVTLAFLAFIVTLFAVIVFGMRYGFARDAKVERRCAALGGYMINDVCTAPDRTILGTYGGLS